VACAPSPADIAVQPICAAADKARSLSAANASASELQVHLDVIQEGMSSILMNMESFQQKYGQVESAKLVSRLDACLEGLK
jgi:hypothetical protein